MTGDALQERREDLVMRHIAGENDRDLEAVMSTFTYPRYEIIPSATVYDGESAVRQMILRQWEELPWLRYSAHGIYHGTEGVVVETRTTYPGTEVDMLSVNVFVFEGSGLILERCYFDRMLFAEQLERASRQND